MRTWNGYQRGINLGGWISQCPYEEKHYETFITEEDIKTIAAWGLDHVRLPIDYEVIDGIESTQDCKGICYVDRCVEWCKKYELNLILDLHRVPGYAFYDGGKNCLFGNEEMEERFIQIWKALATRYEYRNDHVAFELLKEIVEETSERWNRLAHRAIQAIREIAPTTKILVGGIQWNSAKTVCLLEKPQDENIVYNFHFYEPFLFTHQAASWVDQMPTEPRDYPGNLCEYQEVSRKLGMYGSGLFTEGITSLGTEYLTNLIKEAVDAAAVYDAYLYCGEYGVISMAPGASIVQWFHDMHDVFETYGIGRAAWTYKSKSFGISDEYEEAITAEVIPYL